MALSDIFTRASVSELKQSKWIVVEGTKQKFGKNDLKQITDCTVLSCTGKHGEYKALKIEVSSMKKAFWFTLDVRSTKVCSHMEEVDPSKVVVYDLTNVDTGETITRVRILE